MVPGACVALTQRNTACSCRCSRGCSRETSRWRHCSCLWMSSSRHHLLVWSTGTKCTLHSHCRTPQGSLRVCLFASLACLAVDMVERDSLPNRYFFLFLLQVLVGLGGTIDANARVYHLCMIAYGSLMVCLTSHTSTPVAPVPLTLPFIVCFVWTGTVDCAFRVSTDGRHPALVDGDRGRCFPGVLLLHCSTARRGARDLCCGATGAWQKAWVGYVASSAMHPHEMMCSVCGVCCAVCAVRCMCPPRPYDITHHWKLCANSTCSCCQRS